VLEAATYIDMKRERVPLDQSLVNPFFSLSESIDREQFKIFSTVVGNEVGGISQMNKFKISTVTMSDQFLSSFISVDPQRKQPKLIFSFNCRRIFSFHKTQDSYIPALFS